MLVVASQMCRGGYAVQIPVLNASFEEPPHPLPLRCTPAAADCSWNEGSITNWAIPGPRGTAGVFHPNPTQFDLPLPDRDGAQTAYSEDQTLYQTLPVKIQKGKRYTLSVSVGRRKDKYWDAIPGYIIGLYTGTTPLAYDNSSQRPDRGRFATATVSYTADAAYAGEPLTIVLYSYGRQTNFDNVQLW